MVLRISVYAFSLFFLEMIKSIYWIAICLLHPTTLARLTVFKGKATTGPGHDELDVKTHNSYRLPTSVRPEHYKLEVITHLGDDDGYEFSGKVWIKV